MEDRKFICPCYRHQQDIAETGHCLCSLFVSDAYEPLPVAESAAVQDSSRSWPEVVVYGASWCAHTLRVRQLFNRHGVPYTLVDVEDDLTAAQKVMGWNRGYLSTPTLDIAGRIVTEPSDEELADLLGLDLP